MSKRRGVPKIKDEYESAFVDTNRRIVRAKRPVGTASTSSTNNETSGNVASETSNPVSGIRVQIRMEPAEKKHVPSILEVNKITQLRMAILRLEKEKEEYLDRDEDQIQGVIVRAFDRDINNGMKELENALQEEESNK
jgi:hypothetical protein